jgi:hypothetical protein
MIHVVIYEEEQGSSSPADPGAVKTILPQETDEVEEKTGEEKESKDNNGENDYDAKEETCWKSEERGDKARSSCKVGRKVEMTEEEKKTVIRELLFSTDEEKDKEERRRKADDLAWARRKRDAMLKVGSSKNQDWSKIGQLGNCLGLRHWALFGFFNSL